MLTGLDGVLDRLAATLAEAALLGVVAHGAFTPAGRALCRLLEAGAAHHYPAVPGGGADPPAAAPMAWAKTSPCAPPWRMR
ncbi:hypothetical protein ACFXEL_01405 [Streptomyces sp. NPDC059382]|uniref:hypothetical protein n=1 Tax=Streptomyces sp. NPDC059382 TaxID=3346816 RepID=UPI0036C37BD6